MHVEVLTMTLFCSYLLFGLRDHAVVICCCPSHQSVSLAVHLWHYSDLYIQVYRLSEIDISILILVARLAIIIIS